MKRIYELIKEARKKYKKDKFFSNFEEDIKINQLKKRYYMRYDRALTFLDQDSWQTLKEKAFKHYMQHRNEEKLKEIRKESFFNILNEAFAYRYLVRKGCENVRILENSVSKTPDISFLYKGKQGYCEVKTINPSDDELKFPDKNEKIQIKSFDGKIIKETSLEEIFEIMKVNKEILKTNNIKIRLLDDDYYRKHFSLKNEFLNKLNSTIDKALQQIKAMNNCEIFLIYLVLNFDDFTHEHYKNYRKEIIDHLKKHSYNNIFIRIGNSPPHRGFKRISIDVFLENN